MDLAICYMFVLRLVHAFIWTRMYLWTFLRVIILNPLSKFFSLFSLQPSRINLERCRADSRNLSKLPLHIGLQILENRISHHDVTSLIVWCMAVGIPYISVFDVEGHLKKSSLKLKASIDEKVREVCKGNSHLVFQLEAATRNENISWEVLHKAESLGSERTRIALISSEDGRQNIIDTARQFCCSVTKKLCKPSDIDVPKMDALVNASMTFPDPDLIVQFGSVESLVGYLPWKIRVTEILSVPSHINIDYVSFLSVLQMFAKTQQRFGK